MTHEEILSAAREAKFSLFTSGRFAEQECIEKFATIIREATKEECIKLCRDVNHENGWLYGDEIAQAIREEK
jgi:hypothetical protein